MTTALWVIVLILVVGFVSLEERFGVLIATIKAIPQPSFSSVAPRSVPAPPGMRISYLRGHDGEVQYADVLGFVENAGMWEELIFGPLPFLALTLDFETRNDIVCVIRTLAAGENLNEGEIEEAKKHFPGS